MSLGTAILCGLLYYLGQSQLFYHVIYNLRQPLPMGFIIGLIFGDPQTGALVGAAIQPMYLVNYSLGGTTVNDVTMAAIVPVSLVLGSGMTQEAAVAIAVPLGLLGAQLTTVCYSVIALCMPVADKKAAEGNWKAMRFWDGWMSQIIRLIFFAIPVTILLYLGGDVAADFVNNLPAWAQHGMSALSHVLPGMGFAMIMSMIGRSELLPYVAAGFIFQSYTHGSAIMVVCAALMVAFFHVRTMPSEEGEDTLFAAFGQEAEESKHLLTKKDLLKFRVLTWIWADGANNYLTQNACGFAMSMPFIANKIYADDEQERIACYKRHLMPFLTNFNLGMICAGAVLSMEEHRAMDRDSVPEQAIIQVKNALMGPLAAIGDTIDSVTLRPIFLSLGTALVTEGIVAAAIICPLITFAIVHTEHILSFRFGYKLGNRAAVSFLASNKVKKVMEFLSVLGMFTVAGVAASKMSVQCAIVFEQVLPGDAGVKVTSIQSFFDTIMPNLLSLGTLFGMYGFLRKGHKSTTLLYIIMVAGFILGALGILA